MARGQEGGALDVAVADHRHGLEARRDGPEESRLLPVLAQSGHAAGLGRDQDVPCAELGDPLEREPEVLLVVELLPYERLGLALVRRDEKRLGLDPEAERLALGIEHGRDVPTREIARRLRVELVRDVPRQRAGEDDNLRSLRQVHELLVEDPQLLFRHRGPPLVDLRVRAAGRVDHGSRRARLVLDADEVVQDRLPRELLDDARPGRASDESRRDDRDAEQLERASHVDALPAGEGQTRAGAVTLAPLEVGHGQRPVHGRIQGDGHDHGEMRSARWWAVLPAYHPSRRSTPGRWTARAATSSLWPISRLPAQTSTRPRGAPCRTGSFTDRAATTRSRSGRSTSTGARSGRAATRSRSCSP